MRQLGDDSPLRSFDSPLRLCGGAPSRCRAPRRSGCFRARVRTPGRAQTRRQTHIQHFSAPARLPRIDSFERLRHGGQHFEPDIERTMLADGSGPSMMSIARPGMRSTHDMARIVAAPAGPCEVRTERGKNRRVTDSRRTRDAGTTRARGRGVGPYGGRNISRRRDMLNAASTWASTSNLALQQGPQHRRLPFKRDLNTAAHASPGTSDAPPTP